MPQIVLSPQEIEAAQHVLFTETGQYGYPPGDFHFRLIKAMQHADHLNLAKILMIFPEYQRPIQIMRTAGSDTLVKVVEHSTAQTQEGR